LRLKPLSLFIGVGATLIFLIVFVACVIAFTPLREYIPGYADITIRRSIINLAVRADSLEQELVLKTQYIQNINNVISGNISADSIYHKSDTTKKYQSLITSNKPSKEEVELRTEVEQKERYSLALSDGKPDNSGVASFFFFTPLKGTVTSSFKIAESHFGVDVVAKDNEAIKATLDGAVVFAAWTSETGYTMQIQHSNNLISIYKHCSALMKKTGDFVKAGEVIAIVGNSGEQTTGPHLHFELWYNGNPIDPQDYMVF
ncbi:MAG: M23 family metallopeptidase, partial [Bacteroidia bacterium]|nr:M23 family metallopeptidase [Bacteroidia bacterium]